MRDRSHGGPWLTSVHVVDRGRRPNHCGAAVDLRQAGAPVLDQSERIQLAHQALAGPGLPSTATLQRRDARPFHVTDETGTARVEFEKPEEVSFFVTAHLSLSGSKLRASTEIHHAVLDLGVTPFGPIGVEEAAIFVGDEVTVAGVGMRDIDPDGESTGHRNPPMRYVVRAGRDATVAISRKKPSR
jgi:hypothetical protein